MRLNKNLKMNKESLNGNVFIYFSDFPEWEETPERGKYSYSDSAVFEFEIKDKFFLYTVKALVIIDYIREYRPMTWESPAEDVTHELNISVEAISGIRSALDIDMKLNPQELLILEGFLRENLEVLE